MMDGRSEPDVVTTESESKKRSIVSRWLNDGFLPSACLPSYVIFQKNTLVVTRPER